MTGFSKVFFDLLGELMGQPFDDPLYFWTRPCVPRETGSQVDQKRLNPEASGSASQRRLQLRLKALRRSEDLSPQPWPAELTDVLIGSYQPFIGLQAAAYQVSRVARSRGVETELLLKLIETHAETTPAGQRRINVLYLNAALDDMHPVISDNAAYRFEKASTG